MKESNEEKFKRLMSFNLKIPPELQKSIAAAQEAATHMQNIQRTVTPGKSSSSLKRLPPSKHYLAEAAKIRNNSRQLLANSRSPQKSNKRRVRFVEDVNDRSPK